MRTFLLLIIAVMFFSGCTTNETPLENQKTASLEITTNVSSSLTTLLQNGEKIKSLAGSGKISNIIPGNYQLTVEAPGYIAQSESITLSDGQSMQKSFQLKKDQSTTMISIPGGTFMMGCSNEQNECYSNEIPRHSVTLSAYEIRRNEVTQKEWKAIMGTNPSYFVGDYRPVEQVSWIDILTFCNLLSSREGLTPVYSISGTSVSANWNANGYRLPTEAEWEYAAKGGVLSTNTLYSGSNSVEDVAVVSTSTTHEIASKSPNQLGLFDMSGNVREWCWDFYGYYSSGNQLDPKGPTYGSNRVLRGGSWFYGAFQARVTARNDGGISDRGFSDVGFRIVRQK